MKPIGTPDVFYCQGGATVSVTMTIKHRPSGYVAGILRPMVQRNMTPKVQRARDAVVAAAPVGKPDGRGRTPGALKRSVRMYARDGGGRFASQGAGVGETICSYEIALEVHYAGFVIRGTSPHIIRSHGPWPLRNSFTGQVFGPIVRHPGTRPNDFLTRAMKASGF